MLKIAVALTAALFLVPATKPAVADETHGAEIDQLCSYCEDYTDAAMAAGTVSTAYQVGVGYPEGTQIAKLVDAGRASTSDDGRK